MTKHGTEIRPVSINESMANFRPNEKENYISYGLRPVSGIGDDFLKTIIDNRPYVSVKDFIEKTEPTKSQMVTLIKSGAFDEFNSNRVQVMKDFIKDVIGFRKKITMATLPKVIEAGLFPIEDFRESYSVYEYNRYLKAMCKEHASSKYYILDERASGFFVERYDSAYLTLQGSSEALEIKQWEKLYNKAVTPIRQWLKDNSDEIILGLADFESELEMNHVAPGTISKWEMDSMSFYHTEHELAFVDFEKYGITNFDNLSEEPNIIEYGRYPKYETSSIIGTVIGKNKTKGTFDLLTPEGTVVLVKMYKGDFSYYDKQISEHLSDGKKKILEKSWFQRGNKIFTHGFRRGDQFIPKKYASTPYPSLALIVDENVEEREISLKTSRG